MTKTPTEIILEASTLKELHTALVDVSIYCAKEVWELLVNVTENIGPDDGGDIELIIRWRAAKNKLGWDYHAPCSNMTALGWLQEYAEIRIPAKEAGMTRSEYMISVGML